MVLAVRKSRATAFPTRSSRLVRPALSLSSNSFSLYSVHPREKPLTTVQVVEFEISLMKDLGVKIEYGKELGRDFTVESLRKDGYEAVFLGIGMPKVATWLA